MSSVRLFTLGAFARHGEMHGHQLLLLAEQEHVQAWTDVSVGSLYQVIRRLAADGLLAQVRTETYGRFPQRRIFTITDDGRAALRNHQRQELRRVRVRNDPFDLALSRPDPARLDELPAVLQERLHDFKTLLERTTAHRRSRQAELTVAENWAFDHHIVQLETEVTWLRRALTDVAGLIDDERHRARRGGSTKTGLEHTDDGRES